MTSGQPFVLQNCVLLAATHHTLQSNESPDQYARIQNFFSEGVQLFLVNEWIQIRLISGHHWPPFRWRADDGSTLNAGLV